VIYQDLLDARLLASYTAAMNARAGAARAPGRLTVDGLRDRILESGGCCEWCGCSLVNAAFELDHILSLSRGGANKASNLVLSCPDCNRKKGQKHPARFAAEIHHRTGRKTALVRRVLERYGIEPAKQNALFTVETREPEKPNDTQGGQLEPAPYTWPE